MENFTFIIFIFAILITLSAFIEKIRLPNPVLFVAAGLAIGFIPVLPDLTLDPDVVFIIFLPPLLYDAAFKTSWNDLKTNARPIAALAVSLVFFTILIIAITAHYLIPGFGWPLAFLLGAIISPPDAVAATGIIKGLGLNKRVITILEGESLLNDASALVAYRYALAALTTGGFLFWQAGLQFLLIAVGGIFAGVVVGYVLIFAHKKIRNNPVVETALTLITPFLSYLFAEQFRASGVLSVVITGLMIAWRSPKIFSYQTRMQSTAVWDTLIFLLNGFIFILIGTQLPGILKQLSGYTFSTLAVYGLVISAATILVRIIWVIAGAYSAKLFRRKKEAQDTTEKENEISVWKNVLVISWTGTRGIISLAAALALPFTLYNGDAFPQRALILFLCFIVIFTTLVIQGLSLPLLVRLLDIKPEQDKDNEVKALQLYIANKTLQFIDNELPDDPHNVFKHQLKAMYEQLAKQLNGEIQVQRKNKSMHSEILVLTSMQNAEAKIFRFQRTLLFEIHKEGIFSDKTIKKVEQNMDIDAMYFNSRL